MTYTVQGTDISLWQDDISTPQHVNFDTMKNAGAKFVFIKVSQATYLDRDYVLNWNNAKGKVPRGPYHYMDWTKSALEQARFFAGVLQADPGELPAVLDCEHQSGAPLDSANQFKIFCDEYFRLMGKQIMIYTSYGYWGEHGSLNPYWLNYKLWVANYTTAAQPAIPKPWTNFTFWQYTSQGNGPYWGGEERYIDLNWYKGSIQEFDDEFNINSGSVIPPTEPKYLDAMVIAKDGVNIRTVPNTNNVPIGVASYNTKLQIKNVYAPTTAWGQLLDGNWVALKYQGTEIVKIQ